LFGLYEARVIFAFSMKRKRDNLPSVITIMNLLCGFMAIMIADFYKSSILLLCCLVFDALDGMTARALKAQSEVGKELDSLADLVSFGIAPAYLYFKLAPSLTWYAYIPPLFLVAASALRLAKFNLLPSSKYFTGLPTPATALFLIGIFLSYHYNKVFIIKNLDLWLVYWIIPVFFAFMMLSSLQMFTLKGLDRKIWKNKFQVAMFFTFIILLLIDNKYALSLSVVIYIILSFVQSITSRT
jgi:CDP-diacylglycerol--serine O-phosphatidyltransferase